MKHIPKHLRSALPFAAVLVLLVGSVILARAIHSRPSDLYHVNTSPEADGAIYTVRVFDTITSVVVIDWKNHSRKKKIALENVSYDRASTRLSIAEALPFAESVIHIEGTSVQPEQFRVYDFDGPADFLFVLLKDRPAIEGYEYSYDETTRLVTFRSDIHPERDGNFHIGWEAADGPHHGFGNWSRKDRDRLAELEWQWRHKTQGPPMLVVKDRSDVSNHALSKEAGFPVRLPKGDGTFLIETMDGTEKHYSIMRSYDDAGVNVECKAEPFEQPERIESEEFVQFGKIIVGKQHVLGIQTNGHDEEKSVALIVYSWEQDGGFYQITVEEGKEAAAERLLGWGRCTPDRGQGS